MYALVGKSRVGLVAANVVEPEVLGLSARTRKVLLSFLSRVSYLFYSSPIDGIIDSALCTSNFHTYGKMYY